MDYDTLKIIWWLIVGFYLIGFALTVGFDLGIAILLPWLGRSDGERSAILATVMGTWEGNQVWLVTLGGVLFAVWPLVYGTLFSGPYLAVMALLFSLLLRPAGFDFRNKFKQPSWRRLWDWVLFTGGLVPAFLLGVILGNLLLGLPFRFDAELRMHYTGGFFDLLHPFALLGGVITVALLTLHGACFLQCRTLGPVCFRARAAATVSALVAVAGMGIAVLALLGIDGYQITAMPDPAAAFSPLEKQVEAVSAGWLVNFLRHPWMLAVPLLAIGGTLAAAAMARQFIPVAAFWASSVALAATLLSVGFALFPFLLPSSLAPDHSLTVWDAASSPFTLKLVLAFTLIFLPIVITYTGWVYRVLWGQINTATLDMKEG